MTKLCWYVLTSLLWFLGSCQALAQLPDPIRVVISNDTFPYMYSDEHGQPAGLVADYWREVARQQHVQLELVAADWPQTLAMLQQHQVDVHGAMARTPQRDALYQLTDININAFSNVFIHKDLPKFTSLTQLKPFVIGMVENSGHISALNELLPGAMYRFFANNTALYDAALHGEIQAFAGVDRLSASYARADELLTLFPMYKKVPIRRLDLAYATFENQALKQQIDLATAQLSTAFLDGLERRWLASNVDDDTLLLGVSVDNQPYMHVSSQGEAQGLFVDLYKLWSDKTGIKVAFVADSSSNNLSNLQNGRIDAMVAFPATPELPADLTTAYHLYSFNSEFYYPRQQKIGNLSELAGQKIGVFYNASYLKMLQQNYPDIEFVRFYSLEKMVAAVKAKSLAGFYGASAIMPLRLQQLNAWDYFVALEGTQIQAPLYSLINVAKPELAETIRHGFSLVSLEALEQAEEHWISNQKQRYFSLFRSQIPLTDEERQWLAQNNPLRVGIIDNWPPMEFVDADGNNAGVTVDVLKLLAERMNIRFELHSYQQFDVLLGDLKQKKVDLVANVADLEERKSFASFTDEFWSIQWAVISDATAVDISSAEQLNGKRIAIFKDYQLAQHINEIAPDVVVTPANNLRDAMSLLQKGQVDYVLDSVEAAGQLIRQMGYVNMRVQLIDGFPVYPSLIAVRNDYLPLVTILNKGLRSIQQPERRQLYQKWFDFQVTQSIDKDKYTRLMWQISGAVLLLIIFFVIWNLSLRREVKLRRLAEQKMRFMATHDDLTQLPNRGLLKERVDQALLQHSRHNETLALLFIDLDGFKDVNDQYGHDTGDELLLQLAVILQDTVRKSDTVARFGGDEFVVLLTGLLNRNDAAIVAEKILQQLQPPLILSVGAVQIGASIGIAVYPDDGTDSARLLKVADSLMYRIKQQGKNQYCFSKPVFS